MPWIHVFGTNSRVCHLTWHFLHGMAILIRAIITSSKFHTANIARHYYSSLSLDGFFVSATKLLAKLSNVLIGSDVRHRRIYCLGKAMSQRIAWVGYCSLVSRGQLTYSHWTNDIFCLIKHSLGKVTTIAIPHSKDRISSTNYHSLAIISPTICKQPNLCLLSVMFICEHPKRHYILLTLTLFNADMHVLQTFALWCKCIQKHIVFNPQLILVPSSRSTFS